MKSGWLLRFLNGTGPGLLLLLSGLILQGCASRPERLAQNSVQCPPALVVPETLISDKTDDVNNFLRKQQTFSEQAQNFFQKVRNSLLNSTQTGPLPDK